MDGELRPKNKGTINDWADILIDTGYSKLADELHESKEVGISGLERLDLPRPFGFIVTPEEFFADPDQYLGAIPSEQLYLNLFPTKRGLEKFTQLGVQKSLTSVVSMIKEKIQLRQICDYKIGIYEFYEDIFGGNIVINPNGHVVLEMGEGTNLDYTRNNKIPAYCLTRNIFTRSFQYTFEDEEMRRRCLDIMRLVPSIGEGRDIEYMPGYYEFVLFKKQEEDQDYKVHFLDYRQNPKYQMSEEFTMQA